MKSFTGEENMLSPLNKGRSTYKLTVDGLIASKQSLKKGRQGQMYVPTEVKTYQMKIGWLARQAQVPLLKGPIEITVKMYLPNRKWKDAENMLKAIFDGLKKIAWQDDSQIAWMVGDKGGLLVQKFLDVKHPRLELVWQEV